MPTDKSIKGQKRHRKLLRKQKSNRAQRKGKRKRRDVERLGSARDQAFREALVEAHAVVEMSRRELNDPKNWRVGTVVSRDGRDEHRIDRLYDNNALIEVTCISSPPDGWHEGDVETDTAARYTFVRHGPASCDGCSACCMEQSSPPGMVGVIANNWGDLADYDRLAGAPDEALRLLADYMETDMQDGQPCIWLDQSTQRCKFYEHRPSICRDFYRGSEGCESWRELYHIEGARNDSAL